MDAALTIAGAALILLGLRDMFHTLMHPGRRGGASRRVLAAAWWLSRRTGHRAGSAAGPAGMVAIITLWVGAQAVGWALIYLPHVPEGFQYASGIEPGRYSPVAEALYFSLTTLTTLGYGDMVAIEPWIRVIAPLEALTGFVLLTTALAWFAQIYPPLSRRRALALQLHRLADAGYARAVADLDAVTLSRVLDGLAADVAAVRVDFEQHAEGFYLHEGSEELSLARHLPYALQLRDAAAARPEPAVRLSVTQVTRALEQLGAGLRQQFLRSGESTEEVFAAYAADHGHDAPG